MNGRHTSLRVKRAQVRKACRRCRSLQKGCSPDLPCVRCTKAGVECQDDGQHESRSRAADIASPFAATQPFVDLPATSPQSVLNFPTFQIGKELLQGPVLEFCEQRYRDYLFPTLPLLSQQDFATLRNSLHPSEPNIEAYCLLAALSAHVFLVVESPTSPVSCAPAYGTNLAFGKLLLAEAYSAREQIQRRPASTSLLTVLAVFWIYNAESAMSHHSRAFYFLREATTLFLLLRNDPSHAEILPPVVSERLFWILLITERSHAVRYRRPTTLYVTDDSPILTLDSASAGLRSLVALFQPLNTTIIGLLNQEQQHGDAHGYLNHVEEVVAVAVNHSATLHNTQKANLRITQLWLRIIIWQLRLRLGHLSENSQPSSLAYHYPLEVARELVLSTRDLPLESIRVHGVGISEKIFDVSCALVDVLARIPLVDANTHGIGITPNESLRYLQNLLPKLHGGMVYDGLLAKHVQQSLNRAIAPTAVS